jgi:hypothetical protein
VYSDSTITDEPLVQQTDEISNADDEDAHTSTDTVDSADEDESARSASQQEDTLDMDTSQHTDEHFSGMVVRVCVFQFFNILSNGSLGRNRWSLKQSRRHS